MRSPRHQFPPHLHITTPSCCCFFYPTHTSYFLLLCETLLLTLLIAFLFTSLSTTLFFFFQKFLAPTCLSVPAATSIQHNSFFFVSPHNKHAPDPLPFSEATHTSSTPLLSLTNPSCRVDLSYPNTNTPHPHFFFLFFHFAPTHAHFPQPTTNTPIPPTQRATTYPNPTPTNYPPAYPSQILPSSSTPKKTYYLYSPPPPNLTHTRLRIHFFHSVFSPPLVLHMPHICAHPFFFPFLFSLWIIFMWQFPLFKTTRTHPPTTSFFLPPHAACHLLIARPSFSPTRSTNSPSLASLFFFSPRSIHHHQHPPHNTHQPQSGHYQMSWHDTYFILWCVSLLFLYLPI